MWQYLLEDNKLSPKLVFLVSLNHQTIDEITYLF